MTTNAIDKKQLIVASDSRWSADVDADHIVFLDNWGLHKIGTRDGGTIVCAGDAVLIERWMRWFTAPVLDLCNPPALNRQFNGQLAHIVFHIVNANGQISDPGIGGTLDYNDEARFAGTGAQLAVACYSANKCVKTAIGTASHVASGDAYTGGHMLYVDMRSASRNVPPVTCDAATLNGDLANRGSIMNRQTRQLSTIDQYLAKRSGASASQAGLGNLNASAPTGTPAFEWKDHQRKELMKAFENIASIEAKNEE